MDDEKSEDDGEQEYSPKKLDTKQFKGTSRLIKPK